MVLVSVVNLVFERGSRWYTCSCSCVCGPHRDAAGGGVVFRAGVAGLSGDVQYWCGQPAFHGEGSQVGDGGRAGEAGALVPVGEVHVGFLLEGDGLGRSCGGQFRGLAVVGVLQPRSRRQACGGQAEGDGFGGVVHGVGAVGCRHAGCQPWCGQPAFHGNLDTFGVVGGDSVGFSLTGTYVVAAGGIAVYLQGDSTHCAGESHGGAGVSIKTVGEGGGL